MLDLNNASNVTIENNTNSKVIRALSGKSIATNKTYQYFTINADFNNMKLLTIQSVIDTNTILDIQLPKHFNQTTNKTVTSGSVESDTVTLSNTTGLNIGGVVKFNHNKLYLITSITSTTIKVYPELLEDVSGDTLISSDINISVNVENDISYNVSYGGLGSISSLTFSEVID